MKSAHFLGIGGIGMSALAHILLEKGVTVSGSDLKNISHLEKLGVARTDTLPQEGPIVYSTAIKEDHPQFVEAKKAGLPLLHRSELLAKLLEEKKGLLVAGTHGKTSTSALLSWILYHAGLNPSYAVGGILKNLDKNGGYGEGNYFALEADESDGSFLRYDGEGAIITNIEKEHLDYWKTEKDLVEGFKKMAARIQNKKLLFWCADDPLLSQLNLPGTSYGRKGELKLLSCEQKGAQTTFSARFEGKTYTVTLPLMGEMLALNALAVLGMALKLGISEDKIQAAFASYQGVKRRQEKIGEINRIAIYDDYAHHPTEIFHTLKSLKKGFGTRRLIALFQPHRYSRTRDLLSEFKTAFEKTDATIITTLYAAGEVPLPGISGKRLAKEVDHALYISQEKLLSYLPKMLIPGDVLVTLGAGDITALGPKLLEALR